MTNLSFGIGALDVSYQYHKTAKPALDGLNLSVPEARIVGLLGLNGSGKTTFLKLLAGWAAPDAGHLGITFDPNEAPSQDDVLVDTEAADAAQQEVTTYLADTYGDPAAMARVFYVGQDTFVDSIDRISANQLSHPYFDVNRLNELCTEFRIDRTKKLRRMSVGQRALASAAIGLAHRVPVLLLDEIQNAIDVPTRYQLYETLMADYADFPRTIVMATHLVSELETIVEHAVVLADGQVLFNDDADVLRQMADPLPAGETSALQYGFLQLTKGASRESK